MSNASKFYVQGCGWMSALGYGAFGSEPQFSNRNSDFKYPDLLKYIGELPSRFGRFDEYSKICFATAVLALNDANMLQRGTKKEIGMIVGSSSGVYDNDIAYFNSTKEQSGAFTSPNLFSYTLPNVALGEVAVFFKFVGPSFCMGNNLVSPGEDVIPAALSLLESGQCTHVLAGWVEVSQRSGGEREMPKGAAFAVVSLAKDCQTKAEISYHSGVRFSELYKLN